MLHRFRNHTTPPNFYKNIGQGNHNIMKETWYTYILCILSYFTQVNKIVGQETDTIG